MYGEEHKKLQKEFDSEKLADKTIDNIVSEEINETFKEFIESRDMFFLSTIDHKGQPTVSYKGGSPGFITVIDEKTLLFPFYDGNGMFLSAGNIVGNEQIGILLIDFETPFRLRIQGSAKRSTNLEYISKYFEALMVIEVTVTKTWLNCNRYIHLHKRLETSKYVPKKGNKTAFPSWKRIEAVSKTLPFDQEKRAIEEGYITNKEWMEKIKNKDA